MEFSDEHRTEVFTAYAKAQTQMGDVLKGATNPAFKSKYADLAAVVEAVTPAFNANGFAVIQSAEFDGEYAAVTTLLAHTSGGWVKSRLKLKPTKADPQGVGSALTYSRRYSLLAMSGAAPEDDDGNAASVKVAQPAPPKPARTLKERADDFAAALRAARSDDEREAIWAKGAVLRQALEEAEPERLEELSQRFVRLEAAQ